MRNMKFVKRIGVAVLAACMVLSCVGCGSSSNKGAAEGTTEVAAEGGQTKDFCSCCSKSSGYI